MDIQFSDVVNVALPAVIGVVGWLAGRRKQRNDFLAEMQSSIDLLSEKNRLFVGEMVQLREENLKLCGEVAMLREENRALRLEIEALNKNLTNVKGNVIAGQARNDRSLKPPSGGCG